MDLYRKGHTKKGYNQESTKVGRNRKGHTGKGKKVQYRKGGKSKKEEESKKQVRTKVDFIEERNDKRVKER